jgi:hypothetical protein
MNVIYYHETMIFLFETEAGEQSSPLHIVRILQIVEAKAWWQSRQCVFARTDKNKKDDMPQNSVYSAF